MQASMIQKKKYRELACIHIMFMAMQHEKKSFKKIQMDVHQPVIFSNGIYRTSFCREKWRISHSMQWIYIYVAVPILEMIFSVIIIQGYYSRIRWLHLFQQEQIYSFHSTQFDMLKYDNVNLTSCIFLYFNAKSLK